MNTASNSNPSKSWTRFLPHVTRILMGLGFVVFGLNGFLNFLPPPPNLPEPVTNLMKAMVETHYMFPLIAGTQLAVGILLVINLFVPFALVLIAPVIVNIIAFHLFLDPAGIVPGLIVLLLEIFLVWAYRDYFRSLFTLRAKP